VPELKSTSTFGVYIVFISGCGFALTGKVAEISKF
jgi:lipoprotein